MRYSKSLPARPQAGTRTRIFTTGVGGSAMLGIMTGQAGTHGWHGSSTTDGQHPGNPMKSGSPHAISANPAEPGPKHCSLGEPVPVLKHSPAMVKRKTVVR